METACTFAIALQQEKTLKNMILFIITMVRSDDNKQICKNNRRQYQAIETIIWISLTRTLSSELVAGNTIWVSVWLLRMELALSE